MKWKTCVVLYAHKRQARLTFHKSSPVFRKLSTLAILPYLSFLCLNLEMIALSIMYLLGS